MSYGERAVGYGREVIVLTQLIIQQQRATGNHISEMVYYEKNPFKNRRFSCCGRFFRLMREKLNNWSTKNNTTFSNSRGSIPNA